MRKTTIKSVLLLLLQELHPLNIREIGRTWILPQCLHLELFPLVHEGLSALLGAEWSLETVRVLVSRDGPVHVAEPNLLLPLVLLLRLSLLEQRVLQHCRIVH